MNHYIRVAAYKYQNVLALQEGAENDKGVDSVLVPMIRVDTGEQNLNLWAPMLRVLQLM